MKTLTRLSALAAAVVMALVAFTVPVGATYRQLISTTTLNGAITASQPTLVLTSAAASTGSSFGAAQVGQCLFMDHELMHITGVSSTTMTVQRQPDGAAAHETATIVYRASCGAFYKVDPPYGRCTQASMTGPWINIISGNIWTCSQDGVSYNVANAMSITYGSTTVPTP